MCKSPADVFMVFMQFVSHLMPNRKRVAVLLDFLSNQIQVEIDLSNLIKETRVALAN